MTAITYLRAALAAAAGAATLRGCTAACSQGRARCTCGANVDAYPGWHTTSDPLDSSSIGHAPLQQARGYSGLAPLSEPDAWHPTIIGSEHIDTTLAGPLDDAGPTTAAALLHSQPPAPPHAITRAAAPAQRAHWLPRAPWPYTAADLLRAAIVVALLVAIAWALTADGPQIMAVAGWLMA